MDLIQRPCSPKHFWVNTCSDLYILEWSMHSVLPSSFPSPSHSAAHHGSENASFVHSQMHHWVTSMRHCFGRKRAWLRALLKWYFFIWRAYRQGNLIGRNTSQEQSSLRNLFFSEEETKEDWIWGKEEAEGGAWRSEGRGYCGWDVLDEKIFYFQFFKKKEKQNLSQD